MSSGAPKVCAARRIAVLGAVPGLWGRVRGDELSLGANFALGTHGPSKTGIVVKLGEGIPQQSRRVAAFKIMTTGSILTFSIPRRALGNPGTFRFTVAAARELPDEAAGGGVDFAPAKGTFRYALAR